MSKKKATKKNSTVGYCKPPVHTQFKPGQSGNPRGRPKSPRDLKGLLIKAINKKADVVVRGRRRRMRKIEIALDQLANKSASGDFRATQTILKELAPPKPRVEVPVTIEEEVQKIQMKMAELSDADLETLANLLEKVGLDVGKDEFPHLHDVIEG